MSQDKETKLTKDDFQTAIVGDHSEILAEFQSRFGSEIDIFLKSIHQCYLHYEKFHSGAEGDRRMIFVARHLFAAINDLVAAARLLIHGFIVPSAVMSRQFVESVMMALLLSRKDLERDFYEEYIEDLQKFRTCGLEQIVEENKEALGISKEGWSLVFRIRDRYHTYRHSTYAALSNIDDLRKHEEGKGMDLGPSFENKKLIAYRAELESLLRATVLLSDVVGQVSTDLIKS